MSHGVPAGTTMPRDSGNAGFPSVRAAASRSACKITYEVRDRLARRRSRGGACTRQGRTSAEFRATRCDSASSFAATSAATALPEARDNTKVDAPVGQTLLDLSGWSFCDLQAQVRVTLRTAATRSPTSGQLTDGCSDSRTTPPRVRASSATNSGSGRSPPSALQRGGTRPVGLERLWPPLRRSPAGSGSSDVDPRSP